jgi:dihydrofolate reductase
MTITIHMVASLDGYIAKPDNSIAWMDTKDNHEKGIRDEDIDVAGFLAGIDCYVMGAKTYEHALELGWPYGDKPVVVLTRRALPASKDSVTFLSGELSSLVTKQLIPKYRNIWMVGGAELTREFLRLGLADDIRITIAPVLIGEGTPFFDELRQEIPLHLKEVSAYRNGYVELWYEIRKG